MKKDRVIAITLLCVMVAAGGQKTVAQTKKEVVPAIELSNMDITVDPAEDFYRYCNGNWLKNNPIPEDASYYDVFSEVGNRTKLQLKEIIEEVTHDKTAVQGSVAQKIRDFYNSGMDSVAINERGYSELIPYFDMIDRMSDKSQLAKLTGQLHNVGFKPFFVSGSYTDFKNADRNIMLVFQGGISLPVRDLYLVEEIQEIRDKYVEHITKMFQLTGIDAALAAQKAQHVLAFETELAKCSLPIEDCQDPNNLYHIMSRGELQASTPIFDWDTYFDAIGAPAFDSLNVASPDFITALDGIINNTDFNTIKDYLKWKVITNSAPQLSDDLVTEDFNFFDKFLYTLSKTCV